MTEPTPKYTRKALEKLWNVLQEIEEIRQLTADGELIMFPYMPPNFQGSMLAFDNAARQRQTIIKKLEASNAIKELGHSESGVNGVWWFKPSLNYKKVFASTHSKEV